MAGDNVAISAGLALINMIKAILELIKTAMETRSKQLGNELKDTKAQLENAKKELEKTKKELEGGKGDKEKLQQKCDDLEKNVKDLEKKVRDLKNQESKVNISLDAIGNAKPEDIAAEALKGTSIDGQLKPEDAAKMTQNIMNIFINDTEKSIKVRAANATKEAEDITFNAQNRNQGESQGMSFNAQGKDNNNSRT